MKRHSLAVLIATTLTVWLPVAVPTSADDLPIHYVQLAKLDPNNAANDANQDFAKGNCILYATGGYTWVLLGTDMNVYNAKKYVIFYDNQTSDVLSDHPDIQNRARAYAQAYNAQAVKNCGAKQ